MPTHQADELQATLNFIREKKAARRLLAGPVNKAPSPSTAPDIAARIAKLKAITAGAKDDLARIAAKTAAAAPPANLLAAYEAMPAGPAKRAFLAANGVQLQKLAKSK